MSMDRLRSAGIWNVGSSVLGAILDMENQVIAINQPYRRK